MSTPRSGYYGVGIDGYLGEAARAKKPVMLHIAEEDAFVSKDSQAKMKAALTNPNYQLYSYPKRDHAFARDGCKRYHAGDARRANQRSWDLLDKHLGQALPARSPRSQPVAPGGI
ncbi:MAG: dienelactone hydrolase family protein [Elusimicrobiota bacterium]